VAATATWETCTQRRTAPSVTISRHVSSNMHSLANPNTRTDARAHKATGAAPAGALNTHRRQTHGCLGNTQHSIMQLLTYSCMPQASTSCQVPLACCSRDTVQGDTCKQQPGITCMASHTTHMPQQGAITAGACHDQHYRVCIQQTAGTTQHGAPLQPTRLRLQLQHS
jgi:hypothetical protein